MKFSLLHFFDNKENQKVRNFFYYEIKNHLFVLEYKILHYCRTELILINMSTINHFSSSIKDKKLM
jgi:hypothetical protein